MTVAPSRSSDAGTLNVDDLLASASEEELEEAGRVSIECLNDRQANKNFSVDYYLQKYPSINRKLLREVLETTVMLHGSVPTAAVADRAGAKR